MNEVILSTIKNFIRNNYGNQEMEDPCYDVEKMTNEITNAVEEYINKENIEYKNADKVYLVYDDCVWYDEDASQIVGVYSSEELAQKGFEEYVKSVKNDLNFENIEKEEEELNRKYVIDEGKSYFSVSVDGEYNSFHTEVSIYEKEIIKEMEDNYEL